VTLLAAAATGLAVYLAARAIAGVPVTLPRRRRPAGQLSQAQLWLVQAGLRVTPRQFWVASALIGSGVFAGVVLLTGTPAVALAPAFFALLAPRLYFARQRLRRLRAVAEAWPDGLRELVSSVAAGMSLPQALYGLARRGPAPLREAFGRFPLLVRILGVVPALEVIRSELADPTSDRVIEVLILAHERGGRVVIDVLRDLAEATTDDVKTSEEIATDALEQKLNARAVFVLPWVVLVALVAAPGHFRDFYQSATGVIVVAVAAVASFAGAALVGRLARDAVEPRVLSGHAPGGLR
jgi:tight adherence protein B